MGDRGEAGEDGRADLGPTDVEDAEEGAQPGDEQVGAVVERELVDVVEGSVDSEERLHPAPQADGQPDDQHQSIAVQLTRVAF